VIYSNLFTGVHGNYLRQSIINAGLDPDKLPQADKTVMNFGSGSASKAWRDIWGAGQGVGLIDEVASVAEIVQRLTAEYLAAKARLHV
jgi:nitronate monooxygenase